MDPTLDINGLAHMLVKVTLKGGRELYLCNAYSDVLAAMLAREPFTAHAVVGMAPRNVVVNPAYVALVEDCSR